MNSLWQAAKEGFFGAFRDAWRVVTFWRYFWPRLKIRECVRTSEIVGHPVFYATSPDQVGLSVWGRTPQEAKARARYASKMLRRLKRTTANTGGGANGGALE